METSIFVTDLAQQFSLSLVGPLTLLSSLSGWPEQAGANFLILGLSFPLDSVGLWRPQFLSPTWLNNFPFPLSVRPSPGGPSRARWPEQPVANFLILGISFLSDIAPTYRHAR
jgi:hypothetical protein